MIGLAGVQHRQRIEVHDQTRNRQLADAQRVRGFGKLMAL